MTKFLMVRIKVYTEQTIKRPPAHAEAKSRLIGNRTCASYAKAKALLRRLDQ